MFRVLIGNDPRLNTVRRHGQTLATPHRTRIGWIKRFRGRARADGNRILAPDARKEGGKIVTLHRDRNLRVDAKNRVRSGAISLVGRIGKAYSYLRRGGGCPSYLVLPGDKLRLLKD